MSRTRVLLACLAAACAIAALPPGAQAGSASPMVKRINDSRRARGLPALRYSPSLARSSTRYARYLMNSNRFGHAPHIRASSRFSRLAEVLGIHTGLSARRSATIRQWLRSAVHRRLLLSRRFRYVGAGKARGRFGGRLTTIWVVQLGRR